MSTHPDPLPFPAAREILAGSAGLSERHDRALAVVLAELGRLTAMEREFAQRLVPEVVATYGERATVTVLQGIVPRLVLDPPTRRGDSAAVDTGGW